MNQGTSDSCSLLGERSGILIAADVSIAHVIGGAERVLFEQASRLVRRGHEVHILTRRLPVHDQDQEIICGVREWRYEISQRSPLSFITTTLKNGKTLFEFLQNKYHFECICFHQPFSALCVILSPKSGGIRKIYTCLSFSFEEFMSRNTKPAGLFGKVMFFLNVCFRKQAEKLSLKQSDKIVVLSRFTQERLWRAYKIPDQKIAVIPGGTDLERFYPAKEKMEIRLALGVPSDKIIIFTVRNLVPRMGLENLVLSLGKLADNAPDIHLILGGEGPLKHDLVLLTEKLGIEEHVTLTGFIPEDKLPSYYRMADLFVLPTLELEGFGLVTLESMASGVPVLGTPVGGTKEILGKFDPELLFKDTDPDSMTALITDMYRKIKENPEMWEKLARRCRDFVESHYSWEKNVDSLEKVLY